jgi:hypothetical protein
MGSDKGWIDETFYCDFWLVGLDWFGLVWIDLDWGCIRDKWFSYDKIKV